MVTSSVCKVTAIGGLTLEMVTGGPALLLPLVPLSLLSLPLYTDTYKSLTHLLHLFWEL